MPTEWLLEGEPYIKYRVMTDLLDQRKEDKEIAALRKSIRKSRLIRKLFDKQNQAGYWGTSEDIFKWWPKKDTTFWMLGILADFGLEKDSREIAAACEYVFGTQLSGGGFGWAPPSTAAECFTGILTESLAKLGYLTDPRLDKAYQWLLNRQRHDGGFWCKRTGLPGRPRQHEPSCAFATLCVMGAISRNADLIKSEVAKKGVKFLFDCWKNRGQIRYAGHDSQVGKGWEKLKYPFTDYKILKYLDIITQFEYSRNNSAMTEMINLLISKADDNGRFSAESIHKCWSEFDFGQKKTSSRWITFLAYRIIKRFTQ